MKISILLPYKENYCKSNAGAVSLFVKDTMNVSIFKKKTLVFGSTKFTDFLSNNYINIEVKEKIYKSSNSEYVKNFIKNKNFIGTDILEIHNRPNYVDLIRKNYKNKIFFYFHNDPLLMLGSKNLEERKELFNKVDKLIFNSLWSKTRFFIGFENDYNINSKTTICYQSTNKVKIDFKKKKKIITFIGKLNRAKGYDLFGNVILKILDKYKDWKAYVIGNEPREQFNFVHKNLINLGFKNNNFVLNFLKFSSISVICSRWDEPFGRSSLEASSRGSATIISNKGGLPETSRAGIILKKLDEKNLYNEIEKLLKNPNKLLALQKKNYRNFYLEHKYVSKILDEIRSKNYLKNFYINGKKILKIIHITNFNYRFDGRLQYNTGRRINNGLIRLGHNVLTISDRDVVNQSRNLFNPTGSHVLQKKILNSYINFKPDLVLFGHADSVDLETIKFLKNHNVKLAEWFLDPVNKVGPDYKNNKKRILEKNQLIDACFLTTDPNSIDFKINNCFFIPNPCDHSFETLENYNYNCENDLFFAMSHGVHRGFLKKGKVDDREIFLKKLIKKNKNIKFDIYGMANIQPIWGQDFINKLSNSAMGLNLSRGKPIKYYSSDRLAQLMGNGLLTFIDIRTKFGELFSKNEIITYNDINDLSYKLNKYKKDIKNRKIIAKNGRTFYFNHFNSNIVAEFIINKTFQLNNKKKYLWHNG